MVSLENYLYGPLGKEYCFLFYFFSVFALLSIFILVGVALFSAVMNKEKRNLKLVLFMLPTLATYFIIYLQNRLLHGMCLNSM